MINVERFINKYIMHGICQIDSSGTPTAALSEGVLFTGEINYSGEGNIYLSYVADPSKPIRNFSFMVVEGNVFFTLQYNYTFIGSKIYPLVEGGAKCINVYVEKEL